MTLVAFTAVILALVTAPTLSLTPSELAEMTSYSTGFCDSELSVVEDGDDVVVTTNGLPSHVWGCVNPNVPSKTPTTYTLPKSPSVDNNGPYCVPPGPIAVATNGVFIFNPLTHTGKNAVEGDDEELFDCCGGHPDQLGRYHYHHLPVANSDCDKPLISSLSDTEAQFVGVALDGFPIYSEWKDIDYDKLDVCHGMTLDNGQYAYIASTSHFPYMLGCYMGTPEGMRTKCSGAQLGALCDCQWGVVTEEMAGTKKRDFLRESKAMHENGMRRELLTELLNYIMLGKKAKRVVGLDDSTAVKETRSTLEDCYLDNCGGDGFSYSGGVCGGSTGGIGGTGTGTGTNTGTGTDSGTNTGTDTNTGTNTGTGSGTNTDTGTNTGTNTGTATGTGKGPGRKPTNSRPNKPRRPTP